MNDAWSNLIDTLAGNERKTPTTWPQRSVHRIMDDALIGDPQPRSNPLHSTSPSSVRRTPMVMPVPARTALPIRLRCPCTNCVAERSLRGVA